MKGVKNLKSLKSDNMTYVVMSLTFESQKQILDWASTVFVMYDITSKRVNTPMYRTPLEPVVDFKGYTNCYPN